MYLEGGEGAAFRGQGRFLGVAGRSLPDRVAEQLASSTP